MAERTRLIEVLGSLSLATDAADGFAPETTIRTAVLAATLAADLGDHFLVSDSLYGALVRHLGCTGFAVEEAHQYGAGDDVGLRRTMAMVDFADPEDAMRRIHEGIGVGAAPAAREAAIGNLLAGPSVLLAHHAAQCDAAERLCALLPVSSRAGSVTTDAFERWDGGGGPAGKGGDDISLVARIVEVAYVAELVRGREGAGAVVGTVQGRRGAQLDPAVVDAFVDRAGELLAMLGDPTLPAWDRLLDAEPGPPEVLRPEQLVVAATAFARFADLKSRFFAGHGEAVARLARAAAVAAGADEAVVDDVGIAGAVHDIGIVGIPTGTWDAPRAHSPAERDRVRFHAWETQRILGATPLFQRIGAMASGVHERVDGTGYHRGLHGAGIDQASRILAAADVAVALMSERPHRPAMTDPDAHRELLAMADDGYLDRAAVAAVLDALGAPEASAAASPSARPVRPAGLSDREVEVLGQLAGGASNKEIGAALGITAKTVAHHVGHIYDKTGCRSRAGATLLAVELGLVGPLRT